MGISMKKNIIQDKFRGLISMILTSIPFVIALYFIANFGLNMLQRGNFNRSRFIYGFDAYMFATSLMLLPLTITGFVLNLISIRKYKLTIFHILTIILCCLCVVVLIIGAFTINTFDF